MDKYLKNGIYIALSAVIGLLGLIVLFSSWFITPEGSVDVVKRFSKASYVTEPGLNFKIPLIDTTTTIEVRTKKNVEDMAAGTSEQMPVNVRASMNWTVKKSEVLALFKDYGSLEQFEDRVIDPRFRAIVKESIAKFKAEETIGKRDIVTSKVKDAIIESTKDLPIEISAINIENVELPQIYLKSIETKQTEKNLADAEVFKLEKQKLEAMRAVNIADAEKESAMKIADGKAYSIKVEAEAEATKIKAIGDAEGSAIKAKAQSLINNPLIVELTKAQQWNGQLPATVMGDAPHLMMNMK